ncbi:MAG: hypothetical protein NTY20_03820 [Candidatus Aenigmarchaeota archaeon]|nr:hypothetical protein [Candidatus Aenigmarchaeota archaeon]
MSKHKKRKKDYMPLTTMPSQLECPRCGTKLKLLGVGAAVPQMYFCMECGYRGSLGLEPGLIKLDKKKKL